MLLTSLVRGLLGWEGDAPNDRVRLAPHLPARWDSAAVERLPVGTGRYRLRIVRARESLTAMLVRTAGRGVDAPLFSPALPPGAALPRVTAGGPPAACA